MIVEIYANLPKTMLYLVIFLFVFLNPTVKVLGIS